MRQCFTCMEYILVTLRSHLSTFPFNSSSSPKISHVNYSSFYSVTFGINWVCICDHKFVVIYQSLLGRAVGTELKMVAPLLKSLPVVQRSLSLRWHIVDRTGLCDPVKIPITVHRMTFHSPSSYLLILCTSLSFLLRCSISLRRACTKLLVRTRPATLFTVHSWSAWYSAFTAIL